MKINKIEGIGEKFAMLLEKAGFPNVEDLFSLTRSQIKKLAKKTGIPAKFIDTWQEHGDLMRIKEINPKLANIINLIGIDSVKELAQRNPKNTLDRIISLVEEKADLLPKLPTLNDIKKWIEEATLLKLGKTREDKKDKQEYGEFGPDYWNNKYLKAPIIYTGRALRGESYNKQIDVDVKTFIKKNDEILQHVIKQAHLKKTTYNETALACQKFACDFLVYTHDEVSADCVEFWQFPFETIQSGIGDCEDGGILIASLMINAGIPSWRVKVCGGNVLSDPIVAPSESGLGGHGYAIYLAERPDSQRGLEWVILDWCYFQDPDASIEEKPLAKNGGQHSAYKDVWFTYNDEYSWSQQSIEIQEGKISNKQTAKKDDVLIIRKELLKDIAKEQIKKILERWNLKIE